MIEFQVSDKNKLLNNIYTMIRSEEMECISMYFSKSGLRRISERLGESSLIQMRGSSKKNEHFDKRIAIIDQIKNKLMFLKNEMEKEEDKGTFNDELDEFECLEEIIKLERDNEQIINKKDKPLNIERTNSKINESNISFEMEIDKCYKRLVDLKSTLINQLQKKKEFEQNLKMIKIAKFFIKSSSEKDSWVINFDFITAISENKDKNLILKMLRHRLRRNIYIKIYEYKYNAIYVIYVVGRETMEYAKNVIENLGGRCYDSIRMLRVVQNNKKTLNRIINQNSISECQTEAPMSMSGFISDDNLIKQEQDSVSISHTEASMSEKIKSPDSAKAVDFYNINNETLENELLIKLKCNYKRTKKIVKTVKLQISLINNLIKKKIESWELFVLKESRILEFMSRLTTTESGNSFYCEAWIPKKDMKKLESLKSFDLVNGRFLYQSAIPGDISDCEDEEEKCVRPTHFQNTPFLQSFQNLTNVFGVPKYQEINPAIFMTFTFPFLFGVMFGDVLHGLILLIIALVMIIRFEKYNNKIGVLQIILDGRYIMLCCSFFAIWFGFLYGDFGSIPIILFNSHFKLNTTYPFGIDPIWHHATNKMVFINSLKMKLSLTIGFAHMGLGSFIAILNNIYFKNWLDLVCITLPQFMSFLLFLGYLIFLCIYKWLVTVTYPSLINTLISMYTDPFNMKEQMYPGQMQIQLIIYILILISIPWMFLSKPIYLMYKKRIPKEGILDLWITSGIHLVEFCLGLISNTSSYLRLWAVSLAHVQLTSVLHQFTIGSDSWAVRLMTSPIYIAGTFLLLIGLEGLSSCLHALRLNWIEFFSKFYKGSGELFSPYNFLAKEED